MAISISSCVRFFDCKKATRFSSGEDATEGSWRTRADQHDALASYVISFVISNVQVTYRDICTASGMFKINGDWEEATHSRGDELLSSHTGESSVKQT